MSPLDGAALGFLAGWTVGAIAIGVFFDRFVAVADRITDWLIERMDDTTRRINRWTGRRSP